MEKTPIDPFCKLQHEESIPRNFQDIHRLPRSVLAHSAVEQLDVEFWSCRVVGYYTMFTMFLSMALLEVQYSSLMKLRAVNISWGQNQEAQENNSVHVDTTS